MRGYCKFILFFILVLQLSCFSRYSFASEKWPLNNAPSAVSVPVKKVVVEEILEKVTLIPPIEHVEHSSHSDNIEALRRIYKVGASKVIKPRFPKPNYSSYKPYNYIPGSYDPSGYGRRFLNKRYGNKYTKTDIEDRYRKILAYDAKMEKKDKLVNKYLEKNYPKPKVATCDVPVNKKVEDIFEKVVLTSPFEEVMLAPPTAIIEAHDAEIARVMRVEQETIERDVDVITAPVVANNNTEEMQDLTAPILSKKDRWIKASLDKDFKPSKKPTREIEGMLASRQVESITEPMFASRVASKVKSKPRKPLVVEEANNPYAKRAFKSVGVIPKKRPKLARAEIERAIPVEEVSKQKIPSRKDGDLEFKETVLTSIEFEKDSSDISEENKDLLNQLVIMLNEMPNQRVQIRAYALGNDTTHSDARRMSLSRGLKVRSYIKNKGIKPVRLDIRALGDSYDRPPPDRVDVVLVE